MGGVVIVEAVLTTGSRKMKEQRCKLERQDPGCRNPCVDDVMKMSCLAERWNGHDAEEACDQLLH